MVALRGLVEDLVVDARRLGIVARELADNALYHSGQGGGWCVVGQSEDHIVVTIRDDGMGIHASMRNAYQEIDEGSAIRAAFAGGVTSETGPVRGLVMVIAYTETGADLLLETGGLAFVGIDGTGQLLGKSTQHVQGVTAMLTVPLVTQQQVLHG